VTHKKLAIIGASYLQVPLIEKAKDMGLETHVFAWGSGDIGEKLADNFYPISIIEKEAILEKCKELKIDGICSIASDLAAITVNYVAANMGLTGNSLESCYMSTNKHAMRTCFEKNGDPSPQSYLVSSAGDLTGKEICYPVIVKPVDRSGSRGITKVENATYLQDAIEAAKGQAFEKTALVEEFVTGQEYSVECISWQGKHHFLTLTKKYTTGAPHFVETGHLEPAPVLESTLEEIKAVTYHALDSLKIRNGASHTELKITENGTIKLIEIGGRMGGDCIGSDLVQLSTGIDFVRAVIEIALDQEPILQKKSSGTAAAIRFICSEEDILALKEVKGQHPEYIVREECSQNPFNIKIIDSASRPGYYLLCADNAELLEQYMPQTEDNYKFNQSEQREGE